MAAKKDGKNSIRGWEIPECGQWIWITKPDPDVTTDRGSGRSCHMRATHRVTYRDSRAERTEHACQAHLTSILDWAAKRRAWARRDGIEVPEPVIVELTFTADAHAAAYGRTRFLRVERVVTGGIEQAVIATQSRIPPPSPRRSRTDRSRASSPSSEPVQESLF